MLIKAGHIANLTDARYFAAREVHFLGFCLDPSSEYFVSAPVVKAMKEWIEGPKIIGEFSFQTTNEILHEIDDIGLDAVQLSMFATADKASLRSKVSIIQEIVVEQNTNAADLWASCEQLSENSDFICLDFEKNNITWMDLVKNQQIGVEVLQRICQKYQVFFSLKFLPNQLNGILNVLVPAGIALAGGEEEKVGLKSFDEIDEIFDVIENMA